MITRETTPLPPRIFRKSGTPLTSSDTLSTILDPINQQFATETEKPCNRLKRWYEPTTGKWHSNDPIGISGGLNQYVFCGNNPVMFVDPFGLDVYQINVSYTTYWVVDTPSGGMEIFHYSGRSWNRGSEQWRVFWRDKAEVTRQLDPEIFLKEYFPQMPPTSDSIRKLADSWRGTRYKTTCDEDKSVLQKFREAFKNQENLYYNAFGIGADSCETFGTTIMLQVLGPSRFIEIQWGFK